MFLTNPAQVHIKLEHAMGYIKGRFSSLRGLCQQIDNPNDHKCALEWVKTCIVIHTLISFLEHADEDRESVAQLVKEGTDSVLDGVGPSGDGFSEMQ
jgi:hypothetical protein